jgi:hypothetical protein
MGFISAFNRAFGALLDLMLFPLDRLAPIGGVGVTAALVAVAMLLMFKATSNQRLVVEAKRLIQAGLFEIRLFNDDPRGILRAQRDILRWTLVYIRLSVIPLLWMILPFGVLTAHLQSHYGYQGINVGDSALIKVQLKPGSEDQARSLTLDLPSGVLVETPMVWIPAMREATWRIKGAREGEYVLGVAYAGARVTKTLRVSNAVGRRSPVRLQPGILNQLLSPSEAPLPPQTSLTSIAVAYPTGTVPVFGWDVHWLGAFFFLSLGFALLLRRHLNVSF